MRRLLAFFRKLHRWLPLLWYDRDWDYAFLLEVLRLKLVGMRAFFESGAAWAVGSDRKAHEIRTAVLLIDRILSEEPYLRWHDLHEREWGEGEFVPVGDGTFLWDRPHLSPEKWARERAAMGRTLEHVRHLEEQDWDALFDLLRGKMRGWWD